MNGAALKGKTILLGVTGGIAAYKACDLTSKLKRLGADVHVIMTKSAQEFVRPLTFETLSGNAVVADMFAAKPHYDVEHISLAKKADLIIVAPATANLIAKLAWGIADDFLTTTVLASKAPQLICPAMNSQMLCAEPTQNNLRTLAARGVYQLYGDDGMLACGDKGAGRLADVDAILTQSIRILTPVKDYSGIRVLVTAGGTIEDIDGVRGITNYSSGKMGLELARAAYNRGAEVTLITGRVSVNVDIPVNRISVTSTAEMRDAVLNNLKYNDIVIKAAAPSDYKPNTQYKDKLKGDTLTLNLMKNPDIAAEVGRLKGDKKLIIFCAETKDLIKSAKQKLASKNADMVVANNVSLEGAGFASDTNIAEIIYKDKVISLSTMLKSTMSDVILDHIKEV